jgi:two-component system, sensor histidine kinase and response regulator
MCVKFTNWVKSLFNSLTVGVVVIDIETKTMVDMNYAAAVILGQGQEDLIGKKCYDYACTSFCEETCPIIDSGLDIENYETVVVREDGSIVDIILNITSVLYENKRYLIKQMIDITNFKKDRGENWKDVENFLASNIKELKKVKRITKSRRNIAKLKESMDSVKIQR